MPAGWIVPTPSADVLRILELHGIRTEPITSSRRATVRLFHVTKKEVAGRPFQGHALVTLTGEDQELTTDIAAGSLFVPANQPLARLAFMLLEPESDDGLAAWGFIGCDGANGEPGRSRCCDW
jgi:hypothetical protein